MKQLLASRLDRLSEEAKKALMGRFAPFPRAGEREAWEKLSPELKGEWIREANTLLGLEWAPLPAAAWLKFNREGNRTDFETMYFRRRGAVACLALAECMEGQGRFLEDLANGIWAVCEESSWCVPAHLYLSPKQGEAGLPDPDEPLVDLFAADTGALLAWVVYLLRDQLNGISPVIVDRIKREVNRRILTPYLSRDDFWWMGFGGREPNNWNPWCNSNCLAAALLLEEEPERRLELIGKAVVTLDRYVEVQYEDGGCDEGVQYWGVAAGSLFDCLELLFAATAGELSVYDQPLIAKLGQYVTKMFIDGNRFVNFADGAAKVNMDFSLVYRYGRRIGDAALAALGLCGLDSQPSNRLSAGGSQLRIPLFRELAAIFPEENLEAPEAVEKQQMYLRESWLPALQVLTAREQGGSADGLHLAIKGGDNDESHNHNDIGHISVALDGIPILADAGVGTYTAQTFGPNRYKIWTMQSGYHNVPVVNGTEQQAGRQYKADVLDCFCGEDGAFVELELARAYPAQAEIISWRRRAALRRGAAACIELTDDYELKQVAGPVLWTFICTAPPQLAAGQIRLRHPELGRSLLVAYDASLLEASFEAILLDDPKLNSVWGPELYRLTLANRTNERIGRVSFRITVEE